MSTGRIRESLDRHGRKRYVAVYTVLDPSDGKRKERSAGTFLKKGEANQALVAALGKVHQGAWSDPSKLTVGEFLTEEWLPSLEVRPRTLESYREITRSWFVPRIGGIKMRDLSPEMVRAFLGSLEGAERRKGRGAITPATVAQIGTVLRIALSEAKRRGVIQRNPAEHVRRPRVETQEMRTWSAEEAQAFEAFVRDDRYHALWVLALATGMRRGELLGLRWADVDLDAKRLSVRQQLHNVKAGKPVVGPPKSKLSVRRLALDDRVVAALRTRRRRQLEERMALGEAWADTGFVFTTPGGDPVRPYRMTLAFMGLVSRSGLPRIRLHDLRHTSASLSLQAGQHPAVVAERMGHSVSMLLNTYSHVLEPVAAQAATEVASLVIGGHR